MIKARHVSLSVRNIVVGDLTEYSSVLRSHLKKGNLLRDGTDSEEVSHSKVRFRCDLRAFHI